MKTMTDVIEATLRQEFKRRTWGMLGPTSPREIAFETSKAVAAWLGPRRRKGGKAHGNH